jgi:hypothetical protein
MGQAKSKKVNCEICNKEVYARGLKSHLRLKHKLKITQVTTQVKLKSGGATQVKPNEISDLKTTQVIEKTTTYTPLDWLPPHIINMEIMEAQWKSVTPEKEWKKTIEE